MAHQTTLWAFIAAVLLGLGCSKQIQVPAITNSKQIDIKLGALEFLEIPKKPLERIYSRTVKQVANDSTSDFDPCAQNGPEVEFTFLANVIFMGIPKKPEIIYKFEDIRYSQFLLDIYYENNQIYLMFENGMMVFIQMSSIGTINSEPHISIVEGLTGNSRLEVGYFVKVSDSVMFINSDYAIKVAQKKASLISGYSKSQGFETVISIGKDIFAVAHREAGVKFYILQGEAVSLIKQIGPQSLPTSKQLSISDMAYYSSMKLLLLLDENNGILRLEVEVSGQQIELSRFGQILEQDYCNLMHLDENSQSVYIFGKQLYKVSFAEYPILSTRVLPHPNIKVREIYTTFNLLVLAGRNFFKLMYLDRLVNTYQDMHLDKILFTDNMVISANEESLFITTYEISEPYISCRTNDKEYLGSHKLQLTTVAQCNAKYLASQGIAQGSLGEYGSEDKCVYTVYQSIYLWEPGQILMVPIIIGLSIFILIGLTVIAVWLLKKFRIRVMQRQLDQYLNIRSGSEIDYQKYEDEKGTEDADRGKEGGYGANSSNASNKKEQDFERNPGNYDIQ